MFYPQETQDVILGRIAALLSQYSVLWAVGGATMLRLRGVIPKSKHITILVSAQDAPTVHTVFTQIGQAHTRELSPNYASRFFCRYTIEGEEMQVISGMMLHYKGFLFTYPFDRNAITRMCPVDDVFVPLTAIEDWYVLYQMMPGREQSIDAIEHYFAENGLVNPERFEVMRRNALPPAVIASIFRWTSMLRRA